MKGFCPLASGSSGNVVYFGTQKVKILFDVGITFKNIRERLAQIEVDIEEIDAVLGRIEVSSELLGVLPNEEGEPCLILKTTWDTSDNSSLEITHEL